MLAHLARDVCEHLVPVIQLDSEHCIRQGLDDAALNLNGTFFGHILHISPMNMLVIGYLCVYRYDGAVFLAPRFWGASPAPSVYRTRDLGLKQL